MNGWLHDGNVPVPSIEAIRFLASQFLGTEDFLEFVAAGHPENAVIEKALSGAKQNDETAIMQFVARELPFLESERLRNSEAANETRMHEWREILRSFLHPSEPHSHGRRAIARGFLEALILRSIFHYDTDAIRGLADVLDLIRRGEDAQATPSNRIASEILGWKTRVEWELQEPPTKAEMRAFLEAYYPGQLSDDKETWSKAWAMANWPTDNDRKGPRGPKGKRRTDAAAALAKKNQERIGEAFECLKISGRLRGHSTRFLIRHVMASSRHGLTSKTTLRRSGLHQDRLSLRNFPPLSQNLSLVAKQRLAAGSQDWQPPNIL